MDYSKTIIQELLKAASILQLKTTQIKAVSENENSTLYGVGFLILPVVLSLILASFIFPSGFGSIFSKFLFWPLLIPVISLASSFFAMFLMAKRLFGAKGSAVEFFRIMAYASVLLILNPLAFLLDLLAIVDASSMTRLIWIFTSVWLGIVGYNVFLKEYKLIKQDAIWAVVLGFFSYLLVHNVLGRVLVGSYFQMFNF